MSSRSEFHSLNGFIGAAIDRGTLGEAAFHRMISLERRRTSRSQKSFLLMLLDVGEGQKSERNRRSLQKMLMVLSRVLRETDITGWYKENSVIGVLLTEVVLDHQRVPSIMMERVTETLKAHLSADQFRQLSISFHRLPELREGVRAKSADLAV